ncbi:hypothetical protein MK338_09585, partial [Streptococcus vestibularis]
LEGQT